MVNIMWARLSEGVVAEITSVDPAGRFHPDLIWQVCSVDVQPGWTYKGKKYSPPVLPKGPAPEVLERVWRDAEIESVKWLRERHRDEVDSDRQTTLTPAQSGELLDYVQALRDWPTAPGFPEPELRPKVPEWLAEQKA
jgi:hypothetical protein